MKKKILDRFVTIKGLIKTVDSSRATTDLRRNQMMLRLWNDQWNWLIDQLDNPKDIAKARVLYGMLSNKIALTLSWDEFKELIYDIMKGVENYVR